MTDPSSDPTPGAAPAPSGSRGRATRASGSPGPDRSSWSARLARWVLPVAWALLALVMGPSFEAALAPRAGLFRSAVSAGLWLVWAVTLAATLIPRTVTLTGVRIVAPAVAVASAWAVAATPHPSTRDAVAIAYATVVTVLAFLPSTGDVFVNGSAYGLERRLPIRVPGPLVLGPLELIWAATVVGLCAGPLLLADRQWIVGGLALVVGWPVAVWSSRSLHILSRRWLVFTPAGLVLHDQLTAVESVLVIRRHLASIGPALVGTEARDLTFGAFGLALEVRLTEPLPVSPSPRRRLRSHDEVTTVELDSFLFTPTRPGLVLTEAAARGLPVLS